MSLHSLEYCCFASCLSVQQNITVSKLSKVTVSCPPITANSSMVKYQLQFDGNWVSEMRLDEVSQCTSNFVFLQKTCRRQVLFSYLSQPLNVDCFMHCTCETVALSTAAHNHIYYVLPFITVRFRKIVRCVSSPGESVPKDESTISHLSSCATLHRHFTDVGGWGRGLSIERATLCWVSSSTVDDACSDRPLDGSTNWILSQGVAMPSLSLHTNCCISSALFAFT